MRPLSLSASRSLLAAYALPLLACSRTPAPYAPAAPSAPASSPSSPSSPSESESAPARPSMTAADCDSAGGEVVYDIGNGAIHRPGYRCPKSGNAPLGKITTAAGQPVAIEGAVCCR